MTADSRELNAAAALTAFENAAARCAATMHEAAAFVARELPNVLTSIPHETALERVCELLTGTAFDVRTELGELAELRLAADAPEVRMRVERIHRWLGEHLPECDRVVERLWDASQNDPRCSGAFVLVSESVANVLAAYGDVTRARERYRQLCAG